jgi:hypothetical protein
MNRGGWAIVVGTPVEAGKKAGGACGNLRRKMKGNSFEKLLEPSRIGSVKTRNRIIKPAAGLQYWIPGGYPLAEKAKWLFDAYARGGSGADHHGKPPHRAGRQGL